MRKPIINNNNNNNNNNNRPRRNGHSQNHSNHSNHNNNQSSSIHSLNYKFDSNSMAGKFSDTALNLIKRYNDLARDAYNNSDIVSAEIFKQYAEHYRKILTDINEARNALVPVQREAVTVEDKKEETPFVDSKQNSSTPEEKSSRHKPTKPRELKVVEIKSEKKVMIKENQQNKEDIALEEVVSEEKPKKIYRRKPAQKVEVETLAGV